MQMNCFLGREVAAVDFWLDTSLDDAGFADDDDDEDDVEAAGWYSSSDG